ncbi:MFS transporter [Streptomyces sp. NPDC048188]|uniref:MFS transporter n=1 Tax=Streptomyces sp. NPDC048188 TaxID=3155749 RepID=UPI003423E354
MRAPGAASLAFWGMVGRFPIAMRSIGCLMLVSAVTGSLGDAGLVAAAMLVSQGVAAPFLGRLADRHSQRRVLVGACLGHAVGMALLLLAVGLELPLGMMVAAAVLTGCTSVSFTGFMRARWASFVDQRTLRTAYAMESMLDDTIFLLGPLLVTVLSSSVHPAGGLVACAVLTVTGSVFVALHRRSEPAGAQRPGERPRRAIGVPAVWVLMITYAGMGFLFGAIDVTMIAFAEERSASGLAGVLLALIAVGSLFAGIAYGAVDWRVSQVTLLVITTSVLMLSAVPLAFAGSLPVMAVLAVVAGVAVSPALIAGSTLLESVAPKGALSEAFSWLNSFGAMGIASGTAVGGRLADAGTSAHAAWAGAAGGLVALVLSLVGQPLLRAGRPAARPAPDMTAAEH